MQIQLEFMSHYVAASHARMITREYQRLRRACIMDKTTASCRQMNVLVYITPDKFNIDVNSRLNSRVVRISCLNKCVPVSISIFSDRLVDFTRENPELDRDTATRSCAHIALNSNRQKSNQTFL